MGIEQFLEQKLRREEVYKSPQMRNNFPQDRKRRRDRGTTDLLAASAIRAAARL